MSPFKLLQPKPPNMVSIGLDVTSRLIHPYAASTGICLIVPGIYIHSYACFTSPQAYVSICLLQFDLGASIAPRGYIAVPTNVCSDSHIPLIASRGAVSRLNRAQSYARDDRVIKVRTVTVFLFQRTKPVTIAGDLMIPMLAQSRCSLASLD